MAGEDAIQGGSGGWSFKQWLLAPAIAAPLFTAVPQWIDSATATFHRYAGGSAKAAEAQQVLANNNLPCLSSPSHLVATDTTMQVESVVCETGDVMIRAMDEKHRSAFLFVSKDSLRARIQEIDAAKAAATPVAFTPAPGAAAFAGARLWKASVGVPAQPAFPAGVLLAQPAATVTVLCTTRIDDRHIRQRIRRPDGCFDQVLDLANGTVTSVTPAPCAC